MTYARSRIDAHMNSDCDAETCPLCATEYAEVDAMSDHRAHFRVDLPEGNRLEQWDSEPCDCAAGADHDAGDEVRA